MSEKTIYLGYAAERKIFCPKFDNKELRTAHISTYVKTRKSLQTELQKTCCTYKIQL